MSLGAFSSLKTKCQITGTATRTVSGLTDTITGELDTTATNALSTKSWTYGTAASCVNQIVTTVVTPAASGTSNVDFTGSLTNIVGDATAAMSAVKAILVELISTDQDSTNGTACSSITIGNGTNPWLAPFGGTGTYTIKNGGRWFHEDPSAAGLAVTASTGDILKVLNNDGSNAAYVRITLLGLS